MRLSVDLKKLSLNLALLTFSTALSLAALEAALRLFPEWIAPRLGVVGTYVYSGYGTRPGDIYFTDAEVGMNFMLPNFTSTLYWDGYFWKHAADAHGFRNPPDVEDRSLLLLGDSLIYGHGVEEHETVAAVLRRRHGRAAYNMARQGDCLYQHYVLSRLYLERFDPRQMVLFVFLNDFHDLTISRTGEQLRERPEIDRYRYDLIARRIEALGKDPGYRWTEQLLRSRAVRLLTGAIRSAGAGQVAATLAVAPPPRPARNRKMPPYLKTILDPERSAPLFDYYRAIVPDLARRCRERDVRLSLVFLHLPQPGRAKAVPASRKIHLFLTDLSAQHDLPYFTTRALFADCPSCFLPRDRHFAPEGHRRLAEFLDREVLPAAASG